MPNRLLKEGICTSDAINMLSSDSEVLFYRLLVVADDYGRMDGRVQIVKSQCFPLKDSFTLEKISDLLEELRQTNLISLYKVDNKPFFFIKKWEQRVRSKGKYPEPTEENIVESPTLDSNPLTYDGLGLGLGMGMGMGKGKGKVVTHTDCNLKPVHEKTPAAIVCVEIKKIGIIDVNPAHPKLLELINIGATVDEFMHAARTAKDKKAGFAYVLGIVEKQRERVKAMSGKLHEGRLPNKQEALEKSNATVASNWVPPELRMRIND